jgi:hypothetical protein
MDTDGPRFDEPVTVRFAPEITDDIAVNLKTAKALMLTVGESGGCRFSHWKPFPGVRVAPGVALTMRRYLRRDPRQTRSWRRVDGQTERAASA